MRINRSFSAALCRVSAVALFAASGSVVLHAQQTAATGTVIAELHQPALFNLAAATPRLSDDGIGYSSSVGSDSTVSPDALSFKADDALQPPPRRRYGRPNYSDRMHNADGSSKLAFLAGGGFTNPVDVSTNYLKISWKAQVGVGYNFNKKFGIIAQFDWDQFGLPGQVITNQYSIYSSYFGNTADLTGLDGNTHVWSFTLNPTYNFYQGDSYGAYAVVGAGFYHKVTQFTLPATGQYCDYYGYCYTYSANQTFDQYTSNAPGINGGLGMTWKPSRFANQKFYAEARFVHNFNSARAYSVAATNLYPGNSSTTSYIPVTIGIRF
ncbi:hypothetical protein SAMN05421771_1505 [Granulicella pectinivorans]|jgi:hypothetical protein|uniref:Outer membrane protein beta-barrel domain-containing protein n=1 Tax=Granulicella pectinivorans TaxID=474950 RepID=A0A1I6LYR4_9BACT|nr:porin family protein [Granulicella pectinivorans]SFS08586.1 hypothetical protein SAMN05421771_1505 [Granulicella pectinivorans]